MRPVARLALALLASGLPACGGSPAPTFAAAPRPVAPPAVVQPPDHRLTRAAVHEAVTQGLAVFLQHVDLSDQPVFVGGKFHGFRIAGLRDPSFWQGVDLKPGDVVVSVNGFPIERPEQAETAFESLDVASELHVTVERDGQPRDLVYAIVDAP
jgi:type II secretion system protein C